MNKTNFTKAYKENMLPKYTIDVLKELINKYPYTDKIFTKEDIEYLNDLKLISFIDTKFDKEMKDVIPLNLHINSLENLKLLDNKYNILLLQFFNDVQKISKLIEDVHLYIILLQEEVELRNGISEYQDLSKKLHE